MGMMRSADADLGPRRSSDPQAYQARRAKQSAQNRQSDTPATSDLEDSSVHRQTEDADHERDFERSLAKVPALLVWKGSVLLAGERPDGADPCERHG